MGEGAEQHFGANTGTTSAEELAGLTARVAALEREIAALSQRLAPGAAAAAGSVARAAAASSGERGEELHGRPAPPPFPDSSAARADTLGARVSSSAAEGSASVSADSAPLAPRMSLENQLGSQVFSRVGILVVLIGVALFLKLAIDNQWIGPIGRVLAGLLAGAGLVVWSERFRRKGFDVFSYALKAVGSGVLYLSLWAAFQLYHLLPGSAALLAMLLVTAWNAYMAWSQRAEVLAAYALVGACGTPLLLSTGGNHESFLFLYLLAIDVATIALVRLRGWPRLLLGVFPATVGYFIGWYVQFYTAEQLALTTVFVGLFFMAFLSVPLRGLSLRSNDADGAGGNTSSKVAPRASVLTDVLLPLANAAFGSLAMYSALQDAHHHDALPWMVLLFAALYLGVMRLPQRVAASAVHLSLAVVFVTVAIPLKASGHWITVAWLVEGAILLWVAARLAVAEGLAERAEDSSAAAYRVLRALSLGALSLGFAGVMVRIYGTVPMVQAFFNHRFATALVGVAAFGGAAWVTYRASVATQEESEKQLWLQIAAGSILALNAVAILATVREIATLWSRNGSNPEGDLQQALGVSAFLMLYGGVLLAIGFWKRSAFVRWQALLLMIYTIAKTFTYDMRNLSQGYRVASFMALGVLLLAVSFAYQHDWLALREKAHGSEEVREGEGGR